MSDERHERNRKVIEEFRTNEGKVGGPFEGSPMILITHKGAKTGTERTNPLVYSRDGEDYVIIASKAGADTHPHWYLNMVANPEVGVEVGTESFRASVREAAGDERTRLYQAQAAQLPQFNDYAAKTDRAIPVLVLTRI